jgi:predicted component of type VI protein secretion system
VNDKIIQDAEVLIEDGATLRVGPLDFHVKVEIPTANPDGTPLPSDSPESAAALAAVKAAAAAVAASKVPPSRDTTPNPARKSGSAPQPGARPAPAKPAAEQSPSAAPKSTAGQEAPSNGSKESAPLAPASESNSDEDSMAAMLLGMDDDGNGSVPEGSTVMDIPTPLAGGADGSQAGKPDEKKNDKKVVQTREEMSSAANDLLRKYMRRPR